MNLMPAFNESCDLFLAKLDNMADGKTVVDMAREFARVTLDVIGKVLYMYMLNYKGTESLVKLNINLYQLLPGILVYLSTPKIQ